MELVRDAIRKSNHFSKREIRVNIVRGYDIEQNQPISYRQV